jgi:hypothetical protein
MFTHSKVKLFQCEMCGASFSRMDARQRHISSKRCQGSGGSAKRRAGRGAGSGSALGDDDEEYVG